MTIIDRTQRNFRMLLQAISYPGETVQLLASSNYHSELLANTKSPSMYSYTILETLIDGEVNFMTYPPSEEFNREVAIYTNGKVANALTNVNYLLTNQATLNNSEHLANLQQLNIGNLEDPQEATTLIIEVPSLTETLSVLQIEGPGIKEKMRLTCPLSSEFITWLSEMNQEFPLGLDSFVVDYAGYCFALPRSSRITILPQEV